MPYIGQKPHDKVVTASEISDGIITADKLASDSLTTAKIADNGVTTAKINADAVTDAKIADDVVGTEHLTAGEVDTTALGADAVTAAKIADNAISEEHLDATVVTGLTALAAEPADTDEFLMSDAGTLKRIDYSYIKGSAGMTLLSSGSVTSTTSQIEITGTQVSDTYEHYRFYLSGKPTDDAPSMNLRYRNSSNDGLISSSGVYSLAVKRLGATNDQLYSQSYNKIELTNRVNSGNNTNEGFNLTLDFMSPRSNSVPTVCMWNVTNASTTDTFTYMTGGARRNDATEVHTGFTVYFSSGDFAEYEYQFYGLQKS